MVEEVTKLESELDAFCRVREHRVLRGQTRSLTTFTKSMFGMLDEIKVAGDHAVPILLVGETGSGKTHLARLTHELSPRRSERCLTVACGALPPNLIESELFGHVKGAFTGADRNRPGKFAAAENGTLILDEIDVLTPDQQAKLLRVIETGEYEAVGSNDTRISNAALIVSSNTNLEELVSAGKFRKDFFYRLNTLSFVMPPLRERVLDIEYLVRKFAVEQSRSYGTGLWHIDPEFLEMMQRYCWPGNIREMENVMRRACLYCRDGVLAPSELPSRIRENAAVASLRLKPDRASACLERGVWEAEYRIISESLQRNNFRRSGTAAELGISRVTLYKKMRKLGIPGTFRTFSGRHHRPCNDWIEMMEPDHEEPIGKIQLLGGDVAISVDLSWCTLDDAALECLKRLPQLQELYLSHTSVTDVGLAHLKGLRQLRTLDLGGTKVTDAGLEHLKDLCRLQTLDLGGVKVTDAGLDHLKDLPQLQSLDLSGAKVTDAGLEHLQALRQLQELGLSGTDVTDAGLEHLRGLPELEKLCFWATGAGLTHLRGLPRLRALDLSGTRVTDAGLEHLEDLCQLQTLDLSSTRVTDAGLEHLQGLWQLQTLDLSGSEVTNAGLEHLAGLRQLQTLDVSGTRVTDAGLEHVTRLRQLRRLGSE